MNVPEIVESYLREQQIPFERAGEQAWTLRLSGERKHSIPVMIAVRERTLTLESFFIRRPLENQAETYRLFLCRNFRGGPVRFAADADGDVYLVAEIATASFDADALDRLLGAVLATADDMFDVAIATGFASYLERDRAWRERGDAWEHAVEAAKQAERPSQKISDAPLDPPHR